MADNKLMSGRYEILELLGKGGMGRVYLGRDTQTGQKVAIKVLPPDALQQEPELLQRLNRESEALRQLDHPNIVKMLDVFHDESGEPALILEYVEGGTLADLLHQHGTLPVEQVLRIAIELSDALTRAHHLKIVHRDIKPSNILLAKDGTPRLTDFGLARSESQATFTQTGTLVGSIGYISPETLQGEPPTPRMDIWAFGVVLYEMLAGRRPFQGDNPSAVLIKILTEPLPDLSQLRPDLPPALLNLVESMLEKDPNNRISSVRRVGAELESILEMLDSSIKLNVQSRLASDGFDSSIFQTPTPSSRRSGAPSLTEFQRMATTRLPTSQPMPMPTVQKWRLPLWVGGIVILIAALAVGAFVLLGSEGEEQGTTQAAEVIAVEPVAPDEMMVLVARLEPLSDARPNVDRFILEDLTETLEQGAPLTKARLREYPIVIHSSEEAARAAQTNQAPIILWGNYTNDFIELNLQATDFTAGQIPLEALQSIGSVRVRLTDERSQSVAPQVLSAVNLIYNYRSEVLEAASALLALNEIPMISGEITGVTAGSAVYRHYLLLSEDAEAAASELDKALQSDPSNPLLYHVRMVALLRTGRLDDAEQDGTAAVRLSNEQWAPPLMSLSSVASAQGDIQKAIDMLDRAAVIQSDDWFLYTVRGALYYLLQDYEQAKADYDHAIALGPTANMPYVFSIMPAIREGRLEDVSRLLGIILTEFPDPSALNRILLTIFGSTDTKQTNAFYGLLLSAFTNLALGKYENAVADTDAALEIRADMPELHMLRGVAYCIEGDNAEAEAAYTSGIELAPDFTVLYLLRADVRSRQNNLAGSLEDLGNAQKTTAWENFAPAVETALAEGGSAMGCESFFPS